MLIEFRVENHRSLREEQVLTLEAGRVGDESDPRPRQVPGHDKRLLPAAVLYGANASGKSNVLSALAFMRDFVRHSHGSGHPKGGVPRMPFSWGGMRERPSTFEVLLLIGETKYQYGFAVSDESVDEEWFYVWPDQKRQVVFERDGDSYSFAEHLTKPDDAAQENTHPDALFLSVAAQHKHVLSCLLCTWFRGICFVGDEQTRFLTGPRQSLSTRIFDDDPGLPPEVLESFGFAPNSEDALGDQIRLLLRGADIGVVDVRITNGEGGHHEPRIQLKHQADDDESWMDLEDESQGTRTLFRLADPIFKTLATGGLLLVDELESSLHPRLGSTIVEMFNGPSTNPLNAQIIFSTHDTNLLGTTLGEPPMRRDQIWFTEKDADGVSRLYPLTDYKPRKVENLERGYLQGRYGAIPFVGDLTRVVG